MAGSLTSAFRVTKPSWCRKKDQDKLYLCIYESGRKLTEIVEYVDHPKRLKDRTWALYERAREFLMHRLQQEGFVDWKTQLEEGEGKWAQSTAYLHVLRYVQHVLSHLSGKTFSGAKDAKALRCVRRCDQAYRQYLEAQAAGEVMPGPNPPAPEVPEPAQEVAGPQEAQGDGQEGTVGAEEDLATDDEAVPAAAAQAPAAAPATPPEAASKAAPALRGESPARTPPERRSPLVRRGAWTRRPCPALQQSPPQQPREPQEAQDAVPLTAELPAPKRPAQEVGELAAQGSDIDLDEIGPQPPAAKRLKGGQDGSSVQLLLPLLQQLLQMQLTSQQLHAAEIKTLQDKQAASARQIQEIAQMLQELLAHSAEARP